MGASVQWAPTMGQAPLRTLCMFFSFNHFNNPMRYTLLISLIPPSSILRDTQRLSNLTKVTKFLKSLKCLIKYFRNPPSIEKCWFFYSPR